MAPTEVDAARFEELADQGHKALTSGEADQAARVLREGLALWRGPAYAEFDEVELLRQEADRLAERRQVALEARIEADLALGRHADLIAELPGLVRAQPLRERLRAQLMLALYRCGRQAEALEVYRDTRQLLAEELGLEPGPELRRLQQAILAADATLDLPTAASRPVVADSVRRPCLLPLDVAGFTGRAEQLQQLDRLLEEDTAPTAVVICALAGTAEVGKTALAVHWAHRVRAAFPDGQLYVNLRGYDPQQPVSAEEALSGLLTALGVCGPDLPAGLEERAARYRSELAGRRMLVILDNAATTDQVRPLLPGTAGCRVVVTSRDSLAGLVALHGARELEVARTLGHNTLDRCRRIFDPDHPITLRSAAALTLALAWLGEAEAACTLGHDTLDRYRRVFGPDHPTTLRAAAALALGLGRLGEPAPPDRDRPGDHTGVGQASAAGRRRAGAARPATAGPPALGHFVVRQGWSVGTFAS